MIRISFFSPTNNFARRTFDFYDEHLVVKIKSLTLDYENEIPYEKIKAIRNKKYADVSWLWIAFVIIGILGLFKFVFHYFGIVSPAIAIIEKVVVILALAITVPSFRKDEVYFFLDADRNYQAHILASVKVDNKSKKLLLQAISVIKQSTQVSSETYLNDPLPNTPPVFEFTEFDFPDFGNRSTVRFYEDRLIDVEKSFVEEVTTVIQYDELTGKTKIAKKGNDNWDYVGSYWLVFVSITSISIAVFFPSQVFYNPVYTRFVLIGFLLLIPLFSLKYIKSEILLFYDKKDEDVYWTRISSANREKLKQVIEFVQGKVLTQPEKPA